MNEVDLHAYLQRVFATSKKRDEEMRKDKPREVQVSPGIYHSVGVSGKVYAIYGERFRSTLEKIKFDKK